MTALIKSALFFLLIPFAAKTPAAKPHPLHVSTSDISYNAQTGKLETICTIFTDDFELAIAKQFSGKIDLQKQELHGAMDVLVKKYVSDHLQIKTNNQPITLN